MQVDNVYLVDKVYFVYFYKRGNIIPLMVSDDCQPKVKRHVKEELEGLDFVRKHSFSKIVEILLLFYKDHKKEFIKWQTKKNKTKNK